MSVNREPHDIPDVLTVANPMASRRWLWVLGVALALLWALLQLSRGQWPWPLVLLPLWAAVFLLARVPLVAADGDGVRVGARRFTWSEVAAIERPADNGWEHQLPSPRMGPRGESFASGSTAARLLETVVLIFDSADEMVIHAVPARKKHLDLPP